MWQKIHQRDLEASIEVAFGGYGESWWRCEDYEIKEEEIVAKYAPLPWFFFGCEIPADALPYTMEEDERWTEYDPLTETPDLFLELAAIHESPNFEEAALDFARRYGVPGQRSGEAEHRYDKMPLHYFKGQAGRAWRILRMYEAFLNRDIETMARMAPECTGPEHNGLYENAARAMQKGDVFYALAAPVVDVSNTVHSLCRPCVGINDSAFSEPLDSSIFKSGWDCGGLLGAAYLHMYWLMTSGGDLAKCEYCGLLMSHGRVSQDGRKRRRDRRFCNDSCRQAHHRSKKKT